MVAVMLNMLRYIEELRNLLQGIIAELKTISSLLKDIKDKES